MRRDPQVIRITPYAANNKRVVSGIVIGKAPWGYGGGRRIKLPAKPKIRRQFRSDQPLILHEAEELPCTIIGEQSCQISPRLAWYVYQKAVEVVSKAGD